MREPIRNRSASRRAALDLLGGPLLMRASRWTEFLANGSGSLDEGHDLPVRWSDAGNVAWRAALPAYGQSSPVVSGGHAFATGVDGPLKEHLLVSAFDLATGRTAWTRRRAASQPIKDSNMVSKAAPTPVVTSGAVIAFFETGNVFAVDRGGAMVWERRLTEEFGAFGGRHGIGSSLRLCRSGVLALVAHDRPSYLICLDPATGQTVWKADRPEGVSWSTPAIVTHRGREIALVSAGEAVEAYDTGDGAALWTLGGFGGAFVASPTPIPGGAVVGSGSKARSAAIRFGATAGERPEVAWRPAEASSYFSSPLVHRGRVYMVSKAGVAFCLRADTGEELWHARLGGQCWASAVGCGDRVYFFGVDGVTTVAEAGDAFAVMARNELSVAGRLYGVAIVPDGILLRYGRDLALVTGA